MRLLAVVVLSFALSWMPDLVPGIPSGVSVVRAQDAESARLFDATMETAIREKWGEDDLGLVMQRVGERFLGKPYVAGMLDAPTRESLIAPLDRFDCVLFVESVFAIARGIKEGDASYEGYLARIEEQRYRGGTIDGYCSRLHYFSEWIFDNERKGLVRNVTAELGGRVLDKRLDFMGRNRSSYRQIAANDSLFAGILAMERSLADLEIRYVEQSSIRSVYPLLRAGDIVALATGIAGLDVVHTGLVYDAGNGRKGLLHASLDRGVVVSPDLQSYVENNRSQIGIVVARPTDTRSR